MNIVDDPKRSIRSAWANIKDFGVALRPMRFGILGLVLIFLVWFETYTGQGRDVLVHYARGGWPHFFWLVGATLVFAVTVWLAMYLAVILRFEEEKKIMIKYRTLFPTADYTHENEEVRKAAAKKRVDWILGWRKWMPLVLGASGPVLTGLFLIFAADAWAKGLVCLAFASVFGLITLPVQLLFSSANSRSFGSRATAPQPGDGPHHPREDSKKSWRENTKELIKQPLDEKTKTAWGEIPCPILVLAGFFGGALLIACSFLQSIQYGRVSCLDRPLYYLLPSVSSSRPARSWRYCPARATCRGFLSPSPC